MTATKPSARIYTSSVRNPNEKATGRVSAPDTSPSREADRVLLLPFSGLNLVTVLPEMPNTLPRVVRHDLRGARHAAQDLARTAQVAVRVEAAHAARRREGVHAAADVGWRRRGRSRCRKRLPPAANSSPPRRGGWSACAPRCCLRYRSFRRNRRGRRSRRRPACLCSSVPS